MFELVDLILAFVAGMGVAVWLMAYLVQRWVDRLRKMLEEAMAEESKSEPSIQDQVSAGKIIPLTIEVENNLYYCYDSNTNQFICQGSDVKEITEKFQQRFPGLNAFFNSGDEQALKTLRQQLKENRENSNSVGHSS